MFIHIRCSRVAPYWCCNIDRNWRSASALSLTEPDQFEVSTQTEDPTVLHSVNHLHCLSHSSGTLLKISRSKTVSLHLTVEHGKRCATRPEGDWSDQLIKNRRFLFEACSLSLAILGRSHPNEHELFPKSFTELQAIIQHRNPLIICLHETHLRPSHALGIHRYDRQDCGTAHTVIYCIHSVPMNTCARTLIQPPLHFV